MPIANRYVGLLAAGACGLVMAVSSASAQDYGSTPSDENGAYASAPAGAPNVAGPEGMNVTVAVPPYRYPWPNKIGAPVENVSISRPVRYDDLDLRSPDGVDTLKARIKMTARMECRDLDESYPVSLTDNPTCFMDAVDDAMYRADMVIRVANEVPANAATTNVASVTPPQQAHYSRHRKHVALRATRTRHARTIHASKIKRA